jgi:hypothetical protein
MQMLAVGPAGDSKSTSAAPSVNRECAREFVRTSGVDAVPIAAAGHDGACWVGCSAGCGDEWSCSVSMPWEHGC